MHKAAKIFLLATAFLWITDTWLKYCGTVRKTNENVENKLHSNKENLK